VLCNILITSSILLIQGNIWGFQYPDLPTLYATIHYLNTAEPVLDLCRKATSPLLLLISKHLSNCIKQLPHTKAKKFAQRWLAIMFLSLKVVDCKFGDERNYVKVEWSKFQRSQAMVNMKPIQYKELRRKTLIEHTPALKHSNRTVFSSVHCGAEARSLSFIT